MATEIKKSRKPVLRRIAEGEYGATEDCMAEYGRLIWMVVRQKVNNPADAEDAVQDILIDIWRSAGRYDPSKGSEATFITTIARRRLVDRLRRHGRRVATIPLDEQGTDEHADGAPAPDRGAEIAGLAEAMAGIDRRSRDLISMSLYEGFSHSEISKKTGIPLGTVKTRIRNGVRQLRTDLELTAAAA